MLAIINYEMNVVSGCSLAVLVKTTAEQAKEKREKGTKLPGGVCEKIGLGELFAIAFHTQHHK